MQLVFEFETKSVYPNQSGMPATTIDLKNGVIPFKTKTELSKYSVFVVKSLARPPPPTSTSFIFKFSDQYQAWSDLQLIHFIQ